MTVTQGSAGAAGPDVEPPAGSSDHDAHRKDIRPRLRSILTTAWFWAVATWVVAYPLSVVAVKVIDANPLRGRGSVLPIAAGLIGGAIVLTLIVRRYSPAIVGIAAGAYSAWVGLTLIAGYHGTPFGESGLRGDSGRLAAMATRFSSTWAPVDSIVPSVPVEYPPLFPWLIGRLSTIVDRPAWTLIGYGEATVISLAVLVAFLLWRGVVSAPVALLLAAIPPWVFGQPRKSYEIMVLAVFVPWVLRAFADRRRDEGGLHWLPAGIIGGLILQTYQGPIMFAAVGILAIIVWAYRRSTQRRAYVLHLVGVLVTSFVVAAWYLVPYIYGTLTYGGKRVNDYFISPAIVEDPLGVWFLTAPGAVLNLMMIIGLVGLVFYRRSRWWAWPMLLLLAGTYVYRWFWVAVFVGNGHTLYLHYTSRVIGIILASAGILTVVSAVPQLAQRFTMRSLRGVAILGASAVLVLAALAGRSLWMPSPLGLEDVRRPAGALDSANLMAYAHAEPLPNGRLPRYAATGLTVPWLPVQQIRDIVEQTRGRGAEPVTLSVDERLFSYYPWPGYVAVIREASNTWTHWDDRFAEVQRLAATKDPTAFADASADTAFGGIDTFVLRKRANGGWAFLTVTFDRSQFDPARWTIVDNLPNDYVVAVRKPG